MGEPAIREKHREWGVKPYGCFGCASLRKTVIRDECFDCDRYPHFRIEATEQIQRKRQSQSSQDQEGDLGRDD